MKQVLIIDDEGDLVEMLVLRLQKSGFLVDVALDRLRTRQTPPLRILDVGTGTGCLAISLAIELEAVSIMATDRSARAIRLAARNAEKNKVSDRISFVNTTYWAGLSGTFDAIVSNPPYLSGKDFLNLQGEVGYEPKRALDGGASGLRAYRHMIEHAPRILRNGGFLIVEIGQAQSREVETLFEKRGFDDVRISKDFSGMERVVSARWSE